MRQEFTAFKFYMVDSASADGTQDLLPIDGLDAELLIASRNDWWASATNIGVRKALSDGCEFILTINDDAIIRPEFLSDLYDLAVKRKLDILAARIDFAHQPGKVWSLGSFSIWGSPYLFQLKFNGYWEDELPVEVLSDDIYPCQALCGDGVLISRRVFEDIGEYQSVWCPQVHADSEFILRANRMAYRAYVATRIVLYNDTENDSKPDYEMENQHIAMDGMSINNEKKVAHNGVVKFLQDIRRVFFFKKSDVYYRPILYIVWKYAPHKYLLPTLIKYFSYKFFLLFIANSARDIRRRIHGRGTSRYMVWCIKRIALWFFCEKYYDREALIHLSDDARYLEAISRKRRLTDML